MTRALAIRPTDTLMFRDGRPFNQSDEGAAAAESLFPPPLPTLVGAVRAALFANHGTNGGYWPKKLLGDGVNWQAEDGLGTLKFGPLLLRQEGNQLLYPAPVILGEDSDGEMHLLGLPSKTQFESDLGVDVPFMQAPAGTQGFEVLDGSWLTTKGMAAVLSGKVPNIAEIVKSDQIFKRESKVGIGINSDRRVVNDAELYMASFLRMDDTVEFMLPVEGLPDELEAFNQRLGGEQRFADFTPCACNWREGITQQAAERGRFAVATISPLYLQEEPKPGSAIPGLPGELVSAAIPKPLKLGGWDSRKGGPLPMHPVVPAGAVFLMKYAEHEIAPVGSVQIGHAQQWGFGHCLIGKWPTVEGQGK